MCHLYRPHKVHTAAPDQAALQQRAGRMDGCWIISSKVPVRCWPCLAGVLPALPAVRARPVGEKPHKPLLTGAKQAAETARSGAEQSAVEWGCQTKAQAASAAADGRSSERAEPQLQSPPEEGRPDDLHRAGRSDTRRARLSAKQRVALKEGRRSSARPPAPLYQAHRAELESVSYFNSASSTSAL